MPFGSASCRLEKANRQLVTGDMRTSRRNRILSFVRVRPVVTDDNDSSKASRTMPAICTSVDPDGQTVVLQSNMHDHKSFRCDHAFRSISSQEDVYMHSIKDFVKKMDQDLVVLAYGTTGSGKTYTMFNESSLKKVSPSSSSGVGEKSDGLAFQALRDLFSLKERLIEQNITITLSFCQLYQEKFYDLFQEGTSVGLSLRENASGTFVEGLKEASVQTAGDACLLVETGLSNRIKRKTSQNVNSSRSHAILSIRVRRAQGRPTLLRFCDLAGSERLKPSAKKSTMAESASINKSISSLATVVAKLSDASGKDSRFVPFRDSKLTRLLASSLKGGARVAVIANVSPLKTSYEGTVSTLMFARKAMTVVQLPPPPLRESRPAQPVVQRGGELYSTTHPYVLSDTEPSTQIRDSSGTIENSAVRRLSARRLKLPSRPQKEPLLLNAADVSTFMTAAADRHELLSKKLERVSESRQITNEKLLRLLRSYLDDKLEG